VVHYTDPMWSLNGDGRPDPGAAGLESDVYGGAVQITFGPFEDGRFVMHGDDYVASVEGADALVIYRAEVTSELLRALEPTCKVVARQGVGLDNLHADLLRDSGIYGFHVPDYCVDEVAVHTLALLLALERQLCVQNREVKAGRWSIHAGGIPRRLLSRTAGIVGFGRIGRASARKLEPFYGGVAAYDPYVNEDLMAGYGVRRAGSLEELLADADAVLLHCPLDDVTRHMIDARALSCMKPDALLVNTARGELVQPDALLAALEDGAIRGFAADVFKPEDPNRDATGRKLLALDNVVITAHRAFLSRESEDRLRERVAQEVAHVLTTGEPPRTGRVA
jgi:phosphoglycerate dehydrogenase-like enzyme